MNREWKFREAEERETQRVFWNGIMKNVFLIMVVVFSSLSAAGAENRVSDPVLKERHEYYEICGCTEKDVQCDLTQKAIQCSDGKKYDSVTNWKVTWDYERRRDGETCTTDPFTVIVDVVYHLPKWSRDPKASRELQEKWEAYTKNLLIHEIGHKDRALAAAREMTSAIAGLPPGRTCAELDREISRISRARVDKLLTEQREYDAATDHGRSQGAVFP